MNEVACKARFFAQRVKYGKQHGYKYGWRFFPYRVRFDEPMSRDVDLAWRDLDVEIDQEFLDWVAWFDSADGKAAQDVEPKPKAGPGDQQQRNKATADFYDDPLPDAF